MLQGRDPESLILKSLPFLRRLPSGFRPHFVAICGEFVGTWLFLFLAFAGTHAAKMTLTDEQRQDPVSETIMYMYIALSFGFSLAVNAWVFFRISGGLFNPAVTFGLYLIGAISWLRGVLLFIAQILGAFLSAIAVSALFPGDLTVQTTLNANTSVSQGFLIEMFLTTELVFTIFMLAAEKHKATFVAPIGIGLALFVSELTGVYFTGGSLNPARSFAPALFLRSFPVYHWIYWLGPMLGATIAAVLYKIFKMLEYETANPGQDHDRHDAANIDLEKNRNPGDHTVRNLEDHTAQLQLPGGRQNLGHSQQGRISRSHHVTDQSSTRPSTSSLADTPSSESMHLALETQPIAIGGQEDAVKLGPSVQNGSLQQNSGNSRSLSKESPKRKPHMWTEGHHVDADGHRIWV